MGEKALLVEFGDTLDEAVNARALGLAAHLARAEEVTACVPGCASVLVEFDRGQAEAVRGLIRQALEIGAAASGTVSGRRVVIPVHYGGADGPDLAFVARHNRLTEAEVVRLHASTIYRVYMIGFAPGFPYLGILPERIAAPRLDTPRARVPAGSVGIAGRQTGIYPRESPGGWRLIGRTELQLFDAGQDPPALLCAGDRVQFVAV